jgi:hypothetical protein
LERDEAKILTVTYLKMIARWKDLLDTMGDKLGNRWGVESGVRPPQRAAEFKGAAKCIF